MGFNSSNASRRSLVFDLEAVPIDNAAEFLEPVSAPSNYVKKEAIDGYIAKATQEALSKCALDVDLARIVALGMLTDEDEGRPSVGLAQNESEEMVLLAAFWLMLGSYPYPRLIGFNVLQYDLPLLYRRSLYLGVTPKPIQMGKYKHPDVDDLFSILSFDGAIRAHSLRFYRQRFRIGPDDSVQGVDIPGLVKENQWDTVADHCRRDVLATAALAQRMGYLHTMRVPEAVF